MKAFEHLVSVELVQPVDGSGTTTSSAATLSSSSSCPKEYRMVRCTLEPVQMQEIVKGVGDCPLANEDTLAECLLTRCGKNTVLGRFTTYAPFSRWHQTPGLLLQPEKVFLHLVRKGAYIHADDERLLRFAATKGYIEPVRLLLDRGADVHARRDIALFNAVKGGHSEVVRLLLEGGANAHTVQGRVLKQGVASTNVDVLQVLLDHGVDLHIQNDEMLRSAAEKGNVKGRYPHVGRLSITKGDSQRALGDGARGADIRRLGQECIHDAVNARHYDVALLLLDSGADIRTLKNYTLQQAARGCNLELIKALLDRGADIHSNNDSALQNAAEKGNVGTVRFLLDHGADIHAQDDGALRNAVERGHIDVVRLLLDRGAHTHTQGLLNRFLDSKGNWKDWFRLDMELLSLLVECGVTAQLNADIMDRMLREALCEGNLALVRRVVGLGADKDMVHIALFNATRSGNLEMVRLLLDRGADIHENNDEALQNMLLMTNAGLRYFACY
ncbi:hypothetical protein HK102_000511 [Quaeritorhiza haematococci]|nr:hypothetical protein HK102_000511 [Quaeritorhiza haematococci]